MRWLPKKAQKFLERERQRLEKEARELISGLVGRSTAEFADTKRQSIEHDANKMYKKLKPDAGTIPTSILNEIFRDLDRRLAVITEGNLLPKVSLLSARVSSAPQSENVAEWAQFRMLLHASAEYHRRAIISAAHLRGLEIPEADLINAMDVCGDWIAREARSVRIEKVAKRELKQLDEIEDSEADDRSKCVQILSLIEHDGPELK